MRHTRIGSPPRTLPDRWHVICRNPASYSLWFPRCIADRLWRDEVRELRSFGFKESWDSAAVEEARTYICELCGNDMELRVYVEPELGQHTYAYCTLAGCHWWLEF